MTLSDIFRRFVDNEDASDIHVQGLKKPSFRIDGKLVKFGDAEVTSRDEAFEMVRQIFMLAYESSEKAETRYEAWRKGERVGPKRDEDGDSAYEVDLALKIPGSAYRARVNVFMSMGMPGFVVRKIPSEIPELKTLGFYEEHLALIRNVASMKEGLILVTGQTGSGKSTTLAAIVNDLNMSRECHIVTIEDPVEFVHKSRMALITHREVGKDTESFYSGLKSAMRQDPDIILVGEIRDEKTALAAIQAAQTGHIVFATLHTNSASESIIRLLDMFPPERNQMIRTSLAESLRMVISQKLPNTVTGKRVLAYEIMTMNSAIYNIVTKGKDLSKIRDEMNIGRSNGTMIPMEHCLEKLVTEKNQARKISPATAMEFANDKDLMGEILRRGGAAIDMDSFMSGGASNPLSRFVEE